VSTLQILLQAEGFGNRWANKFAATKAQSPPFGGLGTSSAQADFALLLAQFQLPRRAQKTKSPARRGGRLANVSLN